MKSAGGYRAGQKAAEFPERRLPRNSERPGGPINIEEHTVWHSNVANS